MADASDAAEAGGNAVQNQGARLEWPAIEDEPVVKLAASASASLDPTGQFVFASDGWCALCGYAREDLVGKMKLHELVPPDDAPTLEEGLRKLVAAGVSFGMQTRLARRGASLCGVTLSVVGVLDREGVLQSIGAVLVDNSESVRAREKLRATEELSRTVFDSSPDCLKILDAEGRVKFVNASGCAQLEVDDLARLVNRHWWDLWPAESADMVREAVKKALAGETAHFQAQCATCRGTLKWWDVVVLAVPSSERGPRRLISVSRDITEIKKEEERARVSADRLNIAMEVANVAICDLDYEIGMAHLTAKAAQIYGFGEEAMTVSREALHVTFHPGDAEDLRRLIEQAWQPESSGWFAREHRIVWRNGETRWLSVRKQIYFDRTVTPARPTRGMLVARDITARKKTDADFRESGERFRTLADNIAQLAWMADATGSIFWYNQRWFDFTNMTMEQMRGWGWRDVHHSEHIGRVLEKWQRHLAAGEEWEDTFPLRRGDGEFRWFLSRAVPIRDENGKVRRWFGTNTDVTEQRAAVEALAKAKEQVERASRAKDDFLAALSHELRTPLTPVLMTATVLESDASLPMEVRDQLAMMRRNIELEARLIDDLLDLTRISRGKLNLARAPTDVHQLLEHTAEIVRSDELGKQVRISFVLEAARHYAFADPTRLQQVFWNLIKNALKFTPSGGSIVVSTRNDSEGWVVVSVEDTGAGISAETLPHIFRAFEQGDVAGQHRYGGLGLGLAISQAIVEAHSGTIRAESAGSGRGAVFTVALSTVDAPVSAAAGRNPASNAERSLRLLVVEDHEATRTVLTRLLSRRGHHVTAVGTIRDGLAAFAAGNFEAVISDLGLPDGSGLELMCDIQRLRPVPGIALSGYGMEEDLRKTKEAGFFAHLVKPVNMDQLRQLLDQLTARLS